MTNLHQFVEQVTGESHLRVEQDLGDGFVRLLSAEAERRQAKHDIRSSEDIVIEMLRNSRDANAQNIFVASWKDGTTRNITILDDGSGIPETMLEKVFEARVTSKLNSMRMDIWGVHGRGMALYAIKVNTSKAIVMASKPNGGGSSIHVEADTLQLGERRDQSAFPVFSTDSYGVTTVRGPKNINRTVMEFAYIERNSCNVWLGSPSEIAAAIYQTGKMRFDVKRNHSNATDLDLPIIDRLATSSSPEEFCTTACSLGLPMSSRTARRILNGQVVPSKAFSPEDFNPTFYDAKIPTHGAPEQKDALESILSSTDDRGLKIEDSDLRVLRESISESFKEIASKYYLNDSVLPEVLVSKGKIRISIPVIKQ